MNHNDYTYILFTTVWVSKKPGKADVKENYKNLEELSISSEKTRIEII